MTWRLAKSLSVLRDQINSIAPNRSKVSDGTIGDTSHSARKSDHNPVNGIVHAMDITHDPLGGCDAYVLAEVLRMTKDRRVKYVISNGRIFSSLVQPWQWRPYDGQNKHAHHTHISVTLEHADDSEPWTLI